MSKEIESKKVPWLRNFLVKNGLFPLNKESRYIIVEFKPEGTAALHAIPMLPVDQAINALRELTK